MASHCLAYGTLSCAAGTYLLIKKVPRGLIKGALLAAPCMGLAWGCIQYFIPYRTCQLGDIVVNCLAAPAGMAPAALLRSVFGSTSATTRIEMITEDSKKSGGTVYEVRE